MSVVVVNLEAFKACVIALLEVGQSTAPGYIDTTYDIATFLMNRMGAPIDVRNIARSTHVRVDDARRSLRSLETTGLFINDGDDKWRLHAGGLFDHELWRW